MRKQTLYAPRLAGDLDLGLEPSRIAQAGGKRWAEINSPGGLLPGQTRQEIWEDSATQKYRIGSRKVVDDRVFHYSYAGEDLTRYLAGYNHSQWPINGALTIQGEAGAYTLSVPDAAGAAGDYAEGWIVIFTTPLQMKRIRTNDATAAGEVVLYLYEPLDAVAIIGTWVTGYPAIYRNVQSPPAPDPDYISFVIVPIMNVTALRWFWGQTWGPCYGVAGGTVPGSAANHRDLYFSTAGNLLPYGDGASGIGGQYAGYLLPRTSLGSGDQFYMLQLQP